VKKVITVVLTIGLVAASLAVPAEAAKKKKKAPKPATVTKVERQAQGTYQAPATVVGNCTQTDGIGCMTIQTGPGETFISKAKVTDSHGQPVVISIAADLDGDMQTETQYGTFCGELTEPIAIDQGAAIVFWVGRADDAAVAGCAPGVGTSGTLDVTFSNMP
jgi:hypothetical protein